MPITASNPKQWDCRPWISPQDVYESEQQLPFVWMRFCELKAMQAAFNYSLLDHLVVRGSLYYAWPNGSEEGRSRPFTAAAGRFCVAKLAFLGSLHVPIWAFQRLWWKELSVASWLRPEELLNDTFDTTAAPVFTPSPDFRCKRFSLKMKTPMEALTPYHYFELGLQEPFHPKLVAGAGGLYSRGLFFGPSLAENASNPYACQEEHLVKLWVPSSKLPGVRNVVLNVNPAEAQWTDSLGGRRGAPCADTHFFGDVSMVPETSFVAADAKKYEKADFTNRTTLMIVVPIPHQEVNVWHYHNDVLADTLSFMGKLASATVIFKIIASIFPPIRQKRHHLLFKLWCLGTPSESEPLLHRMP
eukprot:g20197.t1